MAVQSRASGMSMRGNIMKIAYLAMLVAISATTHAGAQVGQPPPAEITSAAPAAAALPSARSAVATPYSDAYVPRAMRQPVRDITPGPGPVLLRLQPTQKLKQRFDNADADSSGTLSREEARQAGFTVVEKNFDSIDTRQRGHVTFDDLDAYLLQRREEARLR